MKKASKAKVPVAGIPDDGKYSEHTPLMRQWFHFKEQTGDLLLFFRMGDFYELFWEDALRASKLLDIVSTKRGSSGGKEVIMAGVPWHALDIHLARLLKIGVGAAVVDQIGDPALAKGPVERALARIVTPGTLLDEALLDGKKEAPLLAVIRKKDAVGLFWMALSAGQARFCETTEEELESELARIDPAEILLDEGMLLPTGWERLQRRLPGWRFDAKKGRELLLAHFGAQNLSAFGMEDSVLAQMAACAAYGHAQASLGGKRPHMENLEPGGAETSVRMDASTRSALEITQTQRGEREHSLLWALDSCETQMGSRTMRAWLSEPPMRQKTSQKRWEAVEALLADETAREKVQAELGEMCDVERAAARCASALSRPKDCSNLRLALRRFPVLTKEMETLGQEAFAEVAVDLGVDEKCLELLEKAIADEPGNHIRDGGVIRAGWSKELDELRRLSTDMDGAVREMEEAERKSSGIANLKIEFNRAHGFQIEVSKGQAHLAPGNWIRRQTLKNAQRYSTPELEELEKKALSAQEKASRLEKSLFEEAQGKLMSWAPELSRAGRALGKLDVLASFAQSAKEKRWSKPSFNPDKFEAKGVRHPTVEAFGQGEFTPNDVLMNDERKVLLVTGPNMGGKSTYMRSCAILALMARAGSFVPAQSCEIPPFERIFARVGAQDDISKGKSTFMVEMTEAASILRQANGRSLCLIDEIGRGTSTHDGMSLAWACLRHLAEVNKAWTLFSTHYLELAALAQGLKGACNVRLDALETPNGIVFLHQVKDGAASRSYGLDVARLAGVPPKALAWAKLALAEREREDVHLAKDLAPGALRALEKEQEKKDGQETVDSPLELALRAVNPDELTPKRALEELYALRELLGRKG